MFGPLAADEGSESESRRIWVPASCRSAEHHDVYPLLQEIAAAKSKRHQENAIEETQSPHCG
jgi:hypothetical protein